MRQRAQHVQRRCRRRATADRARRRRARDSPCAFCTAKISGSSASGSSSEDHRRVERQVHAALRSAAPSRVLSSARRRQRHRGARALDVVGEERLARGGEQPLDIGGVAARTRDARCRNSATSSASTRRPGREVEGAMQLQQRGAIAARALQARRRSTCRKRAASVKGRAGRRWNGHHALCQASRASAAERDRGRSEHQRALAPGRQARRRPSGRSVVAVSDDCPLSVNSWRRGDITKAELGHA